MNGQSSATTPSRLGELNTLPPGEIVCMLCAAFRRWKLRVFHVISIAYGKLATDGRNLQADLHVPATRVCTKPPLEAP